MATPVSARSTRRRRVTRSEVLAVVLGVLVGVGGCSSATLQSADGFRAANRTKLERLTVGMPRNEIVAIMGTESIRPLGTEGSSGARTERDSMGVTQVQFPLGARGPALYNPMRTAMFDQDDRSWEVLYYYVRLVEDDGVIADDELEPVVLLDGYLAGIGWRYWTDAARQHEIDIGPAGNAH